MSVVRLTDIFLGERGEGGSGEGVGWRTQQWLRKKKKKKIDIRRGSSALAAQNGYPLGKNCARKAKKDRENVL